MVLVVNDLHIGICAVDGADLRTHSVVGELDLSSGKDGVDPRCPFFKYRARLETSSLEVGVGSTRSTSECRGQTQ